MKFEPLDTSQHDRKNFDCGVDALNVYIQRFANQDQKRSLTKVYVLADQNHIIGYYTLSAHSVLRDKLPPDIKLGGYSDIPFLLLGRLAVDIDHQKQGYGDASLVHAFENTQQAAQQVGILGIIVDAKDESAVSFYQGFGFRRLTEMKNRLVLPITAMESASLSEK